MQDLLDLVNPNSSKMYQQSKFSQKFLDQIVEGEYQEYFKGQILEISSYGLIECGTIVAIAGISNVISGL